MEKIKNNFKNIVLVLSLVALVFSLFNTLQILQFVNDSYYNGTDKLYIVLLSCLIAFGTSIALFVLSLVNKLTKLNFVIAALFIYVSQFFLHIYNIAENSFSIASLIEISIIIAFIVLYILAMKNKAFRIWVIAIILFDILYFLPNVLIHSSIISYLSVSYILTFTMIGLELYKE